MAKVLVVDDEQEIREYLAQILGDDEFEVETLESGNNIIDTMKSLRPDIVLLDYKLPGKSGAEVVTAIRDCDEVRATPIIMVTGLSGEEQKVTALENGADDYVVKPISRKELTARIRAVLRRASGLEEQEGYTTLEAKGLYVDLRSHRAYLEGQELHLTLTEFKILTELLKEQGHVLSRDKLRQRALGDLNVTDRTIDVHMASLRKKLGPISQEIQTVRGVGYRLE